jgi:hypothetical protein
MFKAKETFIILTFLGLSMGVNAGNVVGVKIGYQGVNGTYSVNVSSYYPNLVEPLVYVARSNLYLGNHDEANKYYNKVIRLYILKERH